MERAVRDPLVIKLPSLSKRIEQRRLTAYENRQKNWQTYLEQVGQTPFYPGTKERQQAADYLDTLIMERCVDYPSITISFEPGNNLVWFPSDTKLGKSEFADDFRKEAAENLAREFCARDPTLTVDFRDYSLTIDWE